MFPETLVFPVYTSTAEGSDIVLAEGGAEVLDGAGAAACVRTEWKSMPNKKSGRSQAAIFGTAKPERFGIDQGDKVDVVVGDQWQRAHVVPGREITDSSSLPPPQHSCNRDTPP